MKTTAYISLCLLLLSLSGLSQTQAFKDNSKWGIKENETVIIAPRYDSIFNFDAQGKVCLACFKIKVTSPNKFIKTLSTVYSCNYLNKAGKRLSIKSEDNDTSSVFLLGKSTVSLYNNDPAFFTVSVKNKKHLVSKEFRQLTFKGYYDIVQSPDPEYYLVQEMLDNGSTLAHLVDHNEEQVIPFDYSNIHINPYDSLIVGCSAGLRVNGYDDVFNYNGKKLDSYRRHVDLATRHFIIHKLFEPKEYYIIYNPETKAEKSLNADEVQPTASSDEILVRIKNDWYLYDLNTNLKKPFKHL